MSLKAAAAEAYLAAHSMVLQEAVQGIKARVDTGMVSVKSQVQLGIQQQEQLQSRVQGLGCRISQCEAMAHRVNDCEDGLQSINEAHTTDQRRHSQHVQHFEAALEAMRSENAATLMIVAQVSLHTHHECTL